MVTGTAGFIGSKVSEMLLEDGYQVIGVDNINNYYDINLKLWRLDNLKQDNGSQSRDFTYLDDIAEGTVKALKPAGYEIINLGNNNPHKLSKAIDLIKKYTGKEAQFKYKKFHKADMKATWADINKAERLLDWQPKVSLEEGIKRTVDWTKDNWQWVKNIELN